MSIACSKRQLSVKHFLFRFLVCIIATSLVSFTNSKSYGQMQEIIILEQPANGILIPMPDNAGLIYLGDSTFDDFSFATTDTNGFTATEVKLDFSLGHDLTVLDFGGPLPSYPLTWKLTPPFQVSTNYRETQQDKFVVIIKVDQPNPGTRDVWSGTVRNPVVGHTFIEVVNGNTGEVTCVGFYPDGNPGISGTCPGRIIPDDGHDWDVKYEIPITQDQYDILVDKINETTNNPPNYNTASNNCTTWAIGILETIQIDINTTKGSWGIPFIASGHGFAPGILGEDLVLVGGTRNPQTDPTNPAGNPTNPAGNPNGNTCGK